ncbi:oligosaccharide flippase family protein [Candidatus Peregrinibacteria bacterium]|nr:oligosaccharide flippase family protein [Candidatus Peregrinibacteria bacterium]
MSTNKVAISTLWQIASQCTMAVLSIITVKLVAIGLSKELAGMYNSAYGYLQLFGILADFGLYAVGVREMGRAKNPSIVLGHLLILRIVILIISIGCALFFVWIIPSWRESPLPISVTIASLVPCFTLLAGIFRTVFQIHYRMHYVFIAEVTQRIITVFLIGLVLFLGVRGTEDTRILYFFLLVGGIGALILFVLSFLFSLLILRPQIVWDIHTLLHLLKRAAPFGMAYLCIAFYRQFDTTLIALLRPDFAIQNAYYGFVVRVTDMAFLIPTFLLNSALPLFPDGSTKSPHQTRNILERTFIAILILGTISFLFAFLWPRPLMQLLTTQSYLSTLTSPGSDSALRILAVTMPLNGIILFGFYILLSHHHWQPLTRALAFGALLSFSLNLILIPALGFIGASLTSVVVHILLAIHLYSVAYQTTFITLPKATTYAWLQFSFLLAATLWVARPFLTSEIPTIIGLTLCTVLMGLFFVGTGLHKTLKAL